MRMIMFFLSRAPNSTITATPASAMYLPISLNTAGKPAMGSASITTPSKAAIHENWSNTASIGLCRLKFMYAATQRLAIMCTMPRPTHSIIISSGLSMGANSIAGTFMPNQPP